MALADRVKCITKHRCKGYKKYVKVYKKRLPGENLYTVILLIFHDVNCNIFIFIFYCILDVKFQQYSSSICLTPRVKIRNKNKSKYKFIFFVDSFLRLLTAVNDLLYSTLVTTYLLCFSCRVYSFTNFIHISLDILFISYLQIYSSSFS
jgi:hypothetical protein